LWPLYPAPLYPAASVPGGLCTRRRHDHDRLADDHVGPKGASRSTDNTETVASAQKCEWIAR
jgi:hypothetical protein